MKKHKKIRKCRSRVNYFAQSGYSLKGTIKFVLISKFGTKCWLCGKDVGNKITLHHIIPKSYGGIDSYANSSLVCEHCHAHVINQLEYGTEEYSELMKKISEVKNGVRVI